MTPTIHVRSSKNNQPGIDGMNLLSVDCAAVRRNDEELYCLFNVTNEEDEPHDYPAADVTQIAIEWDLIRWRAFRAYIDAAFEDMAKVI
jgi:hypothetical protein